MPARPRFIFCTCQIGAEAGVKLELGRLWPELRFSYSRPGFLTYVLPEGQQFADDFSLRSILVRSHSFSLGRSGGATPEERARNFWQLLGDMRPDRLHVWQRDLHKPGDRGYEPAVGEDAYAARRLLQEHGPPELRSAVRKPQTRPARRGDLVADCVLVEPGEWWVGYHRACEFSARWPGGLLPIRLPPDAISRAWLKMEEALRWARFPIPQGARCAEIGSAPGGSSQALLARGFRVLGIDPAEMDPRVLEHPDFVHLRRRSTQVKRREFRKIRWLMVDMNVSPNYTLDTVEDIVNHRETRIRGLLLTLKLTDWQMIEHMPVHLERIRNWGYRVVRATQLATNRQEICVAALRSPTANHGRRRSARGASHSQNP